MYRHFFNFRENPFKLAPDPAYHFKGRHQEEAIAHLQYAVTEGEGFIAITGEAGVGKTMACRMFVENLDDRAESAYIYGPVGSPEELLKAIAAGLGLEAEVDNIKQLTDRLNKFLMKKKVAGKKVAIFLDDAQNLNGDVLEQVRLLSNLETTRDKLLQIVLIGRPKLAETLASKELRQLGQRVSVAYHIGPLSREETAAYIQHRLSVASRIPSVRFDADAVRRIHKYSGGIPRTVNTACDRALTAAFARKAKRVTGEIAAEAIDHLRGGSGRPDNHSQRRRRIAWAAAGCLLLLAAVGAAHYLNRRPATPPTQTEPVEALPEAPAVEAATEPESGLEAVRESAAEPAPEVSAAVETVPESPPAGQPPSPAEDTPAAEPETVPAYTHSVQVGAFLEVQNAERVASELNEKGYPARIVTITDPRNRTWHTVRIGDYTSRELAARQAAEFSAREKIDTAVRPYNAF